MAVFLGCTSTGWVGLCFLWFFVQELLEAQPAVVLVLKRLRRRGKWLEVSSDRPGELRILKKKTFCGFPWVVTSTAGRVYDLCVYYMTGAPEGSPKVVYGEAGNRTCDPWFTRHSAYPLHHGAYRDASYPKS